MKLTDEQKVYAMWLSLPKSERKPRTQGELAKKLEVSEMTLSRWKKLPAIQAEIDRTHLHYLRDRMGDLYRALVDLAISGKHPKYMEMAFQLAMEQFGKKEVNVTLTEKDAASMSTEELAEKAFKLLNKHNPDMEVDEAEFIAAVATQTAGTN